MKKDYKKKWYYKNWERIRAKEKSKEYHYYRNSRIKLKKQLNTLRSILEKGIFTQKHYILLKELSFQAELTRILYLNFKNPIKSKRILRKNTEK